jgi:hypothetical protein
MTEHTATISRRTLLLAAAAVPALATILAACGDPDVEPSDTAQSPDTTASGSQRIEHPTGASDAVVRITYEGGFVPVGMAFVNTPALVVSGDGKAYVPGVMTMQFPGPLVTPMAVRTITEDGIQTLLQRAGEAGLLAAPPEYPRNDMIADAADTVLTIRAGGETYVHRAYALSMNGPDAPETDPARKALADFVAAATDLTATVGAAELGPESILEPEEYRFQAMPTTEADLAGIEPAPTITDWPASTGIDLTAAAACTRTAAAVVGPIFMAADQITVFRQGDALFSLAVAPVLPGDDPC